MNWTIEKKMFLVGAIIVIGMTFIAANSYRTNRATQSAWKVSSLRNEQVSLLNKMKQSQTNLMLAAMDSIIHKDKGKIETKQWKAINDNIKHFDVNLKTLSGLTLNDQETKWLKKVRSDFAKLSKAVQVDLKRLIEEGALKLSQIETDFAEIGSNIEKNGEPIEKELVTIFQSVQAKQEEARHHATLRNQQLVLLNNMIRTHGNLLLSSLDVTIGKNVGDLDITRRKSIETGVSFISENLDKLSKIADTDAEKESVETITKVFPQLAETLTKDLMQLIDKRASELHFLKLRGIIDAFGKLLEDNLVILFQSVQEKQKQTADQATLRDQQIALLNDLNRAYGKIMLAGMDAIIDKDNGKIDAQRKDQIDTGVAFINNNLEQLAALAETEQEKTAVDNVKNTFPNLGKVIQSDLSNLIEHGAVTAKALEAEFIQMTKNIDGYGAQIENLITKMTASIQKKQGEAAEVSSKLITGSSTLGLVIFLISIGVIVPLFLLISRSITKPLTNAIEVLTNGSDQVTSTSAQVSTASQSLAEGASEQASSIEETSSSLEELASMTRQNADNAQQTNELMKEANRVIEDANHSMKQLTTSMADISSASEETSKIIKTIDEIAFQTNLLALNAAVEAARAGEAGSGFAVVADEVRNLAMRAADAARNTSELIEGTMKRVNDGSDLVNRTNEAFEKVAVSAAKVDELVAEISVASNEQAQGIEQVNKTVAVMDNVTQQVAANAEQSASASVEMNAQSEQLLDIVDNLKSLVKKERQSLKDTDELSEEQERLMDQPPAENLVAVDDIEPNMTGDTYYPQKKMDAKQMIPLDDDDFKDF